MPVSKVGEGGHEWSLVAEALEEVGLWPMKEYIRRRQATIAKYITNIPIYELCTGENQMMLSSRFMRWWDQDITWEKGGDDTSKVA